MEFHEIANIFPLMEGADLDALAADIKAHGLIEPILTWEGKILDGRNRYRACEMAGRDPSFAPWRNGDPLSYIVSTNLHRRHLSTSQRQMIAAKLVKGEVVSGAISTISTINDPRPNLGVSHKKAAELMNVSASGVGDAAQIIKSGNEEVIKAVEEGKMTVNAARAAVAPAKQHKENYARKTPRKAGASTSSPRRATLGTNAARYKQLRDALHLLSGMPDAKEIVTTIPGGGNEIIARGLPHAVRWLNEFNQAWSEKHGRSN